MIAAYLFVLVLLFAEPAQAITPECLDAWARAVAWDGGEAMVKALVARSQEEAIQTCTADAHAALLRDCEWFEGNDQVGAQYFRKDLVVAGAPGCESWGRYSCALRGGEVAGRFSYWGYDTQNIYGGTDKTYVYLAPSCNDATIPPPPPPTCHCSGKACSDQCLFNSSGLAKTPVDGGGCGGNCSGESGPGAAEPVAVFSGNQYIDRKDISLDAGTWIFDIAPHYSAKYQVHTAHGFGWHSVLGMRLFRNDGGGYIVRDASGISQAYSAKATEAAFPVQVMPSGSAGTNNPLILKSAEGPFVYQEGVVGYYFGKDGALDSIVDGNGFGFKMSYEMQDGSKYLAPIKGVSVTAIPADFRSVIARDFRVTRVENLRNSHFALTIQYDTAGYIDSVYDHTGRGIRYILDHDSTVQVGRLVEVRGLEGTHVYHFNDPTRKHVLTLWNAEPIKTGASTESDDGSSPVRFTSNAISSDGRVIKQVTGKRTFEWVVIKNAANSFESGGLLCNGRMTVVQQKISTEMGLVTEDLKDTTYACVPKTWNHPEPPPVYQGGRQSSSIDGRTVDYGEGMKGLSRSFPYTFVSQRSTAHQEQSNLRDAVGQDTLTLEVSKIGDQDTIFTHRKFDFEGRVVRETKGKRFVSTGAYALLNDSVTVSTDFDAKGRFWRDVLWTYAADSSRGSTILHEVTYNTDGTVNTEFRDGIATTYQYSATTYPGKPSRILQMGGITRLFTYDDLGRVATETDPRNGVTHHWYTASGKDSVVVSPAGDTTLSFWTGTRLVQKIANRNGQGTGSETIIEYDADGLDTASYRIENGERKLLTRKSRDAFGRVVAEGDALNPVRKKNMFNSIGYAIGDTIWHEIGNPLVTKKYLDIGGRETAEVLANGDSISYLLDGWGNKLATRRFVKVGAGFVQVSADSAVYSYDNQVLARFDSLAANDWKKTTFLYDMQGNLKRSVGSRLDTTLYGYKDGKRQWTRDAVSKWTWHITDTRGFDSLAVTLAKGHVLDTTTLTYSLQTGDHVTATQHDHAGNLRRTRQGMWQTTFTKAEDLPLVRATGYYPSNRVQADSVPVDIANGKWLVTSYEWNPTGELKKTSRTGGMVTHSVYNARGQKVAELALNAQGTLDTTRTYSYDAAGRLVEERTPGLGSVTKRFDEANRVVSVTDSSGVRSGLKLDALGRVVADTNGLGYVAKHVYGPNADTLIDRNGNKTTVTRDALGRTIIIKDNEGNQTKFFYESKTDGTQRDSVAYPDGTWEVTVTDKGGRTIQKLDKRGVTQSFVYGNDWSMSSVRYEMATKPTLEVVYTRNAKGQVEKIERTEAGVTTAKTEYTFDDAGRVLSQKQTVGADIKTTGYAYDMARRSVTLTLPDGTTRTKVLDERGRLDSVYLDGAMVADYFYDNNKHTGTVLGNGIEAAYGRDAVGRLTSMAYGKNGQDPILRHDLGWDVAGQLKWTKKVPDAIADERYGMDQQGQLTEWKTGVLDVSKEILTPVDSLGWAMDSRGNWANVYDSKAAVDTRAHSGANAINVRNGVTFTYDDAGNLLSDGVNAYEWTLDGMLAKVTNASGSVEYTLDGQKRLVKRVEKNTSAVVIETVTLVWDGWQLVQEIRTNSTNTETRTYTYGRYIDDVVAVHVAGGSTPGTYYYHQGNNHDVEAITNASGQVVERYSVKPYGEYSVSTDGADGVPGTVDDGHYTQSTIGNNIVFQGRPFDAASGLYDFRNRQYSATLGRFVSRDPAGVFANKAFNLYQAFDENPEMNMDPWGLETFSSSGGSFDANIDFPTGFGKNGARILVTLDDSKVGKCDRCEQVRYKQWIIFSLQSKCPEQGNSYWDPCDKPNPGNWYLGEKDYAFQVKYGKKGSFSDYPGVYNNKNQIWVAKTIAECLKKGSWSELMSFTWYYSVINGEITGGFGNPVQGTGYGSMP